MSLSHRRNTPRFLVPEVVQTSGMDCGPATLKCLLEGFGIPVSYGRLREACQTDVDGTSIDTLEEIAVQLGLNAEQTIAPPDHLVLPEAGLLPAIVVVRLPSGITHFVLVWRRHGPLLQIMDPATGRRWLTIKRFLKEIYLHQHRFPADVWKEWAATDAFLRPLRARIARLKISETAGNRLIETAVSAAGWHVLASLDAAVRTVTTLVHSGGISKGEVAENVLQTLFAQVKDTHPHEQKLLPETDWSVWPAEPDADGTAHLFLCGAVLVTVSGRKQSAAPEDLSATEPQPATEVPELSPELQAALAAPPERPGLQLLRLLHEDGYLAPALLVVALFLAAGSVIIEALLLRGLLDIGQNLGLVSQRLSAMGALILFALGLLMLELPVLSGLLRMGRKLEIRFRTAFMAKIPRLSDRYFQSRLISDMAERSHSLYKLRMLSDIGGQFTRSTFELVFTVAGIIWLDAGSAAIAISAGVIALALPLVTQPALVERDLRVRNHLGALSRFHLDAMQGLTAIKTHCAEQFIRREFESLLTEWARAGFGLVRTVVTIEGVQFLTGFGFAGWLLVDHLSRGSESGAVLLLIYWALNLPFLGQEIAQLAWQYPTLRNVTLRAMEPLGAPEEAAGSGELVDESPAAGEKFVHDSPGASLSLQEVSVVAAGHTILREINLTIDSGTHVAVVGPSGAGKSTFAGLFLGWHRPSGGSIRIDGLLLDHATLRSLRRQTVWIDPAVHIWNQSLLKNLQYGNADDGLHLLDEVISSSNLRSVIEKLPRGLQTRLGESGGLLSGGEGQRVRLGRALGRPVVRLVIMDEPFRGLDRQRRKTLLAAVRRRWPQATLLFITHDIHDTVDFDRILVVEKGRIVEDAPPQQLLDDPASRYRLLLEADQKAFKELWGDHRWRKLRLEKGKIQTQQVDE